MRLLAILVMLQLACSCEPLHGEGSPNIVFILVDDLGWSDLHCYGHPYHQTPNIDRLAARGMRYTNAYSPAPICSAARASILTGKAVPRLGFEFVTKNQAGKQKLDSVQPLIAPPITINLPLKECTIAERLSPLGYENAFFGKWHVSQHFNQRYLAWDPDFGPTAQGFGTATEDFGDHPYAWRKNAPPKNAASGTIPDDSMIGNVVDFIGAPHSKPFFVMASTFYVHTPVKNRCRWLVDQYADKIPSGVTRRKERLEYAAFVHTLDHHVGEILDAVDRSEHRDETLVVFASDNGGHPEFCSNAPLRGSKWNLYEGGIRVPMIASWPGRIPAGTQCDTPVIGYDLLPTFVDVAGGTAREVDGISIAETFAQRSLQERSLVWHFPYYHPESNFSKAIDKIGVDDFAVSKTRPQSAIRLGTHKLIRFAEHGRTELYDLSKDISEQNDLSDSLPQVESNLNGLLERRLGQMKARRATRN